MDYHINSAQFLVHFIYHNCTFSTFPVLLHNMKSAKMKTVCDYFMIRLIDCTIEMDV